jgi:hypothetical protein
MKKAFLLAIISFVCINVKAQSLNLDQLLYIIKQDVDEVDTYLSNKRWNFSSTEELSENSTMVTWSFSPNTYDSEKAEAWLNVNFYLDGSNWLYYQTQNKETFNLIKQKVLSIGMEKINASANSDGIYSTYAGQNYIIVLGVTKTEGSYSEVSTNVVKIYPKEDYFKYVLGGENI